MPCIPAIFHKKPQKASFTANKVSFWHVFGHGIDSTVALKSAT